jgi:glyoxylase-like metal-dependent hydrolase (beta-lactamase superfamily II)
VTLPRVHKLQIPTPFPVGPTNAWLIEGKPLTLIDVGPLTTESLAGMEAGLAAHGYRIEDLERLIITHGHIDHFGLAKKIQERSGAQLFLYTDERRMVESFHETHRRIFARYEQLSERAGFPADLLAQQRKYFEIFFRLAEDTRVDHVMADGDELDSGLGRLRVVHCPGHTPGSISLYHEESRVLFSGDNLLRDITTNPFFGGNEQRKVGLVYYIPTLESLLAMDLARVLPGHGPEIDDAAALIRRIRKHHTLRGDLILEELSRGGPMTPYQVARALFPRLPATEVWLALADTMGHLEVLEQEGWLRTVVRAEGDLVELTGHVPASSAIATPARHS